METNLGMNKLLPFLLLGLFAKSTYTNNVSEELRHPRVSGRIVKLYSGIKPEPILCAGEGFQQDPVDCAVFYRCVKGANNKYTVFRYQCGPGTVYDPDTEICNHPKSTKRINCGGFATTPTESVNENEIDESRQEIPSPFNMKQVLYPEHSTKADASTLSTQKIWPSTNYKSTPSYSWITTVKQHLRATRSPLPRQPNPQSGEPCTSDGFMGDSENCRKFYRCVANGRGSYIRYEFSCSESTIWDDETQACNHAWAVKKRRCGRGGPDDENQFIKSAYTAADNDINSEETIQSQLQIAYGSKVNQVQTQISKGTVIQNQTQINYGDRTEEKPVSNPKQNQTQISHGSAVSQTQTQISHGNKASQTQLQIDHSKESSQSQTQIQETTDQTTTSAHDGEAQRPNDEKPVTGNGNNECTESGFMGDSDDCKKFYRCVENGRGGYIKYEFSCGEGTVWDPNAEACNHAWAVKDCKNKSPSQSMPQTSKTTTTTSRTTKIDTIPEEHEDVGYGGQNQQQSQTTTTTATETSIATQTTEGNGISSPISPSGENVCSSSGFMGDTQDCKKFYRCVDNSNGGYTRYEFSCGEGTVWDSSLEACNHAWAVENCGKGTSDKNTQGTTTTTDNVLQDEEIDNGYPSQSNNNADQPTDTTISSTTSSTTLATPTSSSPNSNICKTSGFMGDNNDCKKFYRCVDDGKGGYIRYEFTCGEGTVWDQSIESCNHPSNDNKCTGIETATQQTVNEDATQSSSTAQSASDSDENNQVSTTAPTEKPADKPTTNQDSCSEEGFFGDTTNCKKFYRCVDDGKGGYTKYDFTCGDGTAWDQQAQTCNHESSENKCSETYETNAPESGTTTTTTQSAESSDTTTSTTTRPNTENDNQSSDQCESEGFYANLNDCKNFYRCVSNDKGGYTKYDFTCGEGTIWVQEIQACDHDNDMSNCRAQGTASTSSSQNDQYEQPTTTSSTTITTTEQSLSETDNNDISNNCSNNTSSSSSQSNKCNSEGFYPDTNDCRKFYRCVDNGQGGYTKYDFTCGDGTAWDPDIQACNHENQVKNCQGSQGQNQSEQGSTNENCSQTTESTSTVMTSTTESSSEIKPPSSNDQCENEGYFGDSNDCQKFYRCVDNGNGGLTKYDFTCGEGTIWDQDLQTCNHPGDVKNPSCNSTSQQNTNNTTSTSSTTEASSETSSTSTGSSSSTSTTEGQGPSDCSQDSTQKPSKNQVNCTKAGFYADPDSCKKFYRCVDWDNNGQRFSVYHFDCGEGTIWDPELETCNHEDSVYPPRDCSGTQSQNPNETTTTTTTEKSTTEELTTSEDSTTQQSTTESSTTQETTTTEVSTTEQSTTEKSTTTEKTTTQQSTTEQSTTEKSTTEQTTTQSSTTEQTTEQSSTTEQSTTERSTTEQTSTTEQSTTEQSSTTQQSTTEETTTQQSTTEQSTTEQSTTERSTTEQSTAATEQSPTEGTTESSSTTEQSSDSTTTEDNQESTTQSSSSSKDCPETEDDQYLYVCPTSFKRHPKYCNMFYQCTEDNDTHDLDIAVFKCPNDTIYDESKNQCVDEKNADKKCDGEKADRRRVKHLGANYKEPIVASKDPLTCPSTGHFPFEKAECSPAFLKCDKTKSGRLRGYVNQCPDGYVYWSISRKCEAKFKVRDCKKTNNDWSGRWEIPIERINVAT